MAKRPVVWTARSRQTALALLVLAPLLSPAPAAAWGPIGHRVVGRVAEGHLTPAARQAVAELIAPDSLAEVAVWADWIRSDPAWAHAYTWHFISIDDDETLETAERNPAGDVLEAMERFEAILRDREAPIAERRNALRFLVHFVGDVHQPLHVGRRADRGGNEIVVLWLGEAVDLHDVWDWEMIDAQRLSFSEYAEFLDPATPEEVAAWQAAGYRDWIAESFALREQVYEIGDRRLGFEYQFRILPVVEHRLRQAGVRLAGVLNRALAPPPAPTPD